MTLLYPISISWTHTVTASDGSNSDSVTFTVTSSTWNPVIAINPDSGPVGTTSSKYYRD